MSILLPASKWIERIQIWNRYTREQFEQIYGTSPTALDNRREAYISLLKAFQEKYGNKNVIIARSTGRANLMGRHIEHRGGSINVICINREVLLAASPRNDDRVHLSDLCPRFFDNSFSINRDYNLYQTNNWKHFIESEPILSLVQQSKGEWINYIRAAVLRLQMAYPHIPMRGMDMMFSGDIPCAAGVSSSSAMVVSTMEAAVALNQIPISDKDFVELCGKGEWFVGSRGGAGDHGAMKCGLRGKITHLNFFPFSIGKSVTFPGDYQLIVANSFEEAKKSAGAKDIFNQKVACYVFALMMIKKMFPHHAPNLHYFRDINPDTLRVGQDKIYSMLLALPERVTHQELYSMLPECREEIEEVQKCHRIPDHYDIRGVALYGIAECMRAKKCIDMLDNGDYPSLGRLMNISHDGDRVNKNGKPFSYQVSDEYLEGLIADIRSGDPVRVERAQLYYQPGAYGCSTSTIDEMIDFVNNCDGVVGSELAGAGLGGCILILVHHAHAKNLLSTLQKLYYEKRNLPMGADIYTPIGGSLVL